MLQLNTRTRISAEQALNHPYLSPHRESCHRPSDLQLTNPSLADQFRGALNLEHEKVDVTSFDSVKYALFEDVCFFHPEARSLLESRPFVEGIAAPDVHLEDRAETRIM